MQSQALDVSAWGKEEDNSEYFSQYEIYVCVVIYKNPLYSHFFKQYKNRKG